MQAKDIADIINSIDNTYESQELRRVLATIELRAAVGDYCLGTFTVKDYKTIEVLIDLGYSVAKDDRFQRETHYSISWEEGE